MFKIESQLAAMQNVTTSNTSLQGTQAIVFTARGPDSPKHGGALSELVSSPISMELGPCSQGTFVSLYFAK
jgi:hypothetical protein